MFKTINIAEFIFILLQRKIPVSGVIFLTGHCSISLITLYQISCLSVAGNATTIFCNLIQLL